MAAKAEVRYDASVILPAQIAIGVSDFGYPSSVMEDSLCNDGEVRLWVSLEFCFWIQLLWDYVLHC